MNFEITHRIINGRDAIDTVTVFAVERTSGGEPVWRAIVFTRDPWVVYRHIGDSITLIPNEFGHADTASLPPSLPAVQFTVSARAGIRLGIYADQVKHQIHAILMPQSVHIPAYR